MDVIEIIKDAFVFPSKNIKLLLIFVLLSVVASVLSVLGTLVYALGVITPECFLWGGLACVVAMLIGWILLGYSITVVKSGIEHDDKVPEFDWWENFFTGFNNFVVSIVYFIIPAFITVVAGYLTNIYGNFMTVFQQIVLIASDTYTGSSAVVYDGLAQAIVNLAVSSAITIFVALIVFVIFSFLQYMAEARLANTGSLRQALNVFEAAKDISRIGAGKVISVVILIFVIGLVVEMFFSAFFSFMPIFSFLSVVISPYLLLFTQRAIGLLYSDIA